MLRSQPHVRVGFSACQSNAGRCVGFLATLVCALTLVGCSSQAGPGMVHVQAGFEDDHASHDSSDSVALPEVRRELLSMMAIDQAIREQGHQLRGSSGHERQGESSPIVIVSGDSGHHGSDQSSAPHNHVHGPEMRDVDQENTLKLKRIIEAHGWPDASKVGKEGALAAWLTAQHADLDSAFQRRCLELMERSPKGAVPRSHIAYLTDRVAVNEGRPQRYGTQFTLVDGKMVPQPIENLDELDERRADMGLQSMAEYTQHMEGRNH